MNTIISQLTQHASVRQFQSQPLSEPIKRQLLNAAKAASSSNFVQAYSIIEISDPILRSEMADISGSTAYVNTNGVFYVFIADLYRHAQVLQHQSIDTAGLRNMEALLVACIDTALAAQNMAIAAEGLDLGICYIGGIRNDVNRIAELLNLPPFTVPLFGLAIGYPLQRNEVKPRMPLANNVSIDQYDVNSFTELTDYNELTQTYYAQRNSQQESTHWSHKMIEFFTHPKREDIAEFLKKQGFSLT